MNLSREEMDRAVDQHFLFEANDDVEGVLATLAENVEHEAIPSRFGKLTDKESIRAFYEMLFDDNEGESARSVRRLYGDDFLVDETIWNGVIRDGRIYRCDGKSGHVTVRVLHLFQFRDGLISLEQAWLDLDAIQQQLGCTVA
jgi:hypothetical protein